MKRNLDISELQGKTLSSVKLDEDMSYIKFHTIEGETYELYHEQDCCEHVRVNDIIGDLDDLVGKPILMAEEAGSRDHQEVVDSVADSFTWTFYKLATLKGYVTIRWFGESNGFYSESVSFKKV